MLKVNPMKILRRAASVLAMLILCWCGLTPAQANGQDAWGGAPHIDGVDVEEVARLSPGTRLVFTVFGSAGAQASLLIEGADRRLDLAEGQAGVYEGVYIVGARDRIGADSRATATLRLNNQAASADLDEPLVLGSSTAVADAMPTPRDPEPVAAPPLPQVVQPSVHEAIPRIEQPLPPPVAPPCASCGIVETIQLAEDPKRDGILGAIAGGIIGAILGDQVGHGRDRTTARILGAFGGAYAGHQIERGSRRGTHYDVVVRLPNGERRTVAFSSAPPLKVGDTVSFADGNIRTR
jgi:outer membrane lipoprotein SlyB